jgi:hypothetical protein
VLLIIKRYRGVLIERAAMSPNNEVANNPKHRRALPHMPSRRTWIVGGSPRPSK